VFDDVAVATLRERSVVLTSTFIDGLEQAGLLKTCKLLTPNVAERRGSQVSLAHEQGWGVTQALIGAGVIVDFRAPDIVRFGFSPLYNTVDDVETAVVCLARVIREEHFLDARFVHRPKVT
jgi:kynureninase